MLNMRTGLRMMNKFTAGSLLLKWNIILSMISFCLGEDSQYQSGGYQRMSRPPEKMALWIDGKQIEEFAGIQMNMKFYIIKNGAVVSYILEANHDFQLPTLPPDVDRIELTWMAEVEPFSYKFSELKSLRPDILHHPLLSIPVSGSVPKKQSVFHLSIPCTNKKTGEATMNIILHVYNSMTGQRVVGSPLKIHLKKQCMAIEPRKTCHQSCRNGGKCRKNGQCECRLGYTGSKCEQPICKSACLNGGTCIKPETCACPPTYHGDHCQYSKGSCSVPCIHGGFCNHYNVCECTEGYTGSFCQKPKCKNGCGVNGRCVDINLCECHRGWRGKHCNKTAKLSDQKEDNLSRKRRRRYKLMSNTDESPYRFETKQKARKIRKAGKLSDQEKLERQRNRRYLRRLRRQREKEQQSKSTKVKV